MNSTVQDIRAVALAAGRLPREFRWTFHGVETGPQLVYLSQGRFYAPFTLGCYESIRAAIADGSEPQESMGRFIHRLINRKAGIDH